MGGKAGCRSPTSWASVRARCGGCGGGTSGTATTGYSITVGGAPQPSGFGTLPASLSFSTSDNVTWIVTFVGNTDAGVDGFNSLKDGVYDLNIDAAKVHPVGAPGVTMAANRTTTFHRLFGDTGLPTTPTGGTPGTDYQAIVNTATT